MNQRNSVIYSVILAFAIAFFTSFPGCYSPQKTPPASATQFPSPMSDSIRPHERIANSIPSGRSIQLKDVLSTPVEVFIPQQVHGSSQVDLLIHFHGVGYVPAHAVSASKQAMNSVTVNLGSGSAVYETAFRDASTFPRLLESIRNTVSDTTGTKTELAHIYLSSFSAGYGAVRAILKNHLAKIDGICLLDGLHTDYVPSGRPLAQGGKLNEEKMIDFVRFAQLAKDGQKRFLIAHSEIFPGTYASTTETADYILTAVKLQRHPVLQWGPGDMQMVSETRAGGLTILGFAGNTAPDHVDHLHGLPAFVNQMLEK
ncbi:MAG: hypothetical protein JW828_12365 [Sedimentisphaerales bacterium]|nr:hypothetical protein [Sedimentisphaerales bacterium]